MQPKGLGYVRRKRKGIRSRTTRRSPEFLTPGEKVQIDVREVPYNCLRGELLRNGKHLYQWTAIMES